jgi:4-hydroxy-3-polyprenylbenzoate decarboxylase
MYRVQISGGKYEPNREAGLHYQIHRGIAMHHAAAIRKGVPFHVNVFVGGPPSMALAAAMPLPEGVPELYFAGALCGRRIRVIQREGLLPASAEADFCITGTLDPEKRLPEGPFGDHLGYYSLAHDYPVLQVSKVYHRDGAIWPFTVVGRPPQEDTILGKLIHEITGPAVPEVLPGVHAVHAVDAAGVHPLLLAIGSERYVPYEERNRPQELLTQADAILGAGQLSLAKYLMICAREDAPDLDVNCIDDFLRHVLERVDWRRDVHFQTCTTIDTLDYSGEGLNQGSKAVVAAVGGPRRSLPTEVRGDLRLPQGFSDPRMALPGILCVRGPAFSPKPGQAGDAVERFCGAYSKDDPINAFPLVVIVDDSEFAAGGLSNFLWVTFTRSDPASDIYGIEASIVQKHWGCRGSLVIDARTKPHHAPPVVEDPEVSRRVDRLGALGGPLHGII